MEVIAQEEKRLRQNSYGPSPTIQHHRMQASDSASHNYQPPSGSASNYGAGPAGWAPPPSPFANEPRQSSEVSQHSNSYPPPSRENTYAAEIPYDSRAGSISAQPRSPGDGTVQLLHHVNGSLPDSQYQSQQIPPDFRTRGGYIPLDAPPNGNHPPGLHIATSQEVMPGHQPFPHTPHGPYSHPQSAGPGPGPSPVYETYYQGPHWNNPAVSRDRPKKPVRAQQACDSCRTRKAKCDEARPCSHCKDNSLSCTYRDVPPHKQDRNALALEAKIDSLQREVGSLQREMSSIQQETRDKLNQILRACEGAREHVPLEKLPTNSATMQGTATWPSSQALPNAQHGAMMTNSSRQINHVNAVDAVSLANPVETVNVDSEEMNSLPHSHTTAAQNLLLWPSIKEFGLESDPDYVMNEEESRGLLRIYGRGEGHDKIDTGQLPASPAADSGSSVRADDSPSPPADSLWGYGFRPPYHSNHGIHGDHPGGLNSDGTLNYEPELVDKYFDSYMRHIYILHPFLDKKAMRDHINGFKSRYSRDRQGLVRKRKHEGDDSPNFAHEPHRPTLGSYTIGVERTVRNAMVLLVLALGMICEHKAPLPASPPASSMATVTTSAPTPRSSNSDPFSPIPASPHQHMGARPRAWAANIPERHDSEKNNVDVIPGLAYYNVACDILGGLRGGYDLSHVQAALLAGLYMGQIAQVNASHDWITQAGKACQVLINPKRFPGTMNSKRLDLIKYSYWSCLQLESDILAEMQLPQSGISRFETFMNAFLPHGVHYSEEGNGAYQTDQKADAAELKYYWAQIHLRITLNSVHNSLYHKDAPTTSVAQLPVQKSLTQALEGWRDVTNRCSPEMAWDDNNYMTSDINAARMRAKYYGAKVIINRPTLHAALHEEWSGISVQASESPFQGSGRTSQQTSPTVPHTYRPTGIQQRDSFAGSPVQSESRTTRSLHSLKPEIYLGVKACIQAAIRSTTAFDGVPPRLIVTNIFGTGHAQFGNMLILSAAYNSYLRALIDGKQLKNLFTRTIAILQRNADISPPLKRDMQQLIRLEAKLFPRPALGMTSSFSSEP